MSASATDLSLLFPVCAGLVPQLRDAAPDADINEILQQYPDKKKQFPFLHDLARIEQAIRRLKTSPPLPTRVDRLTVNPTLELISVHWKNLPALLKDQSVVPVAGDAFVLVLRRPDNDGIVAREASGHDLLALKIVSEEMDPREAARNGNTTVGLIDDILYSAGQRGLLLVPPSRLVRGDSFPRGIVSDEKWFTARVFTLQWHITQTCDLHCRHCYDRSERTPMPLSRAVRVLDDLYDFCQNHNVYGQISFTGGNPLLYPHFNELYREAADRGFLTAILGNPTPRHRMEEVVAIRKPEFYQVSLEGLREHNDYIRGKGHFDRVLDFLALLRDLDIYSMVMLTLTSANMDQVLELGELLRDHVDLFTFNRLAMVGEGAALASAPVDRYPQFLADYMRAAENSPCMAMKDNFFNLLRSQEKKPLKGGCAGFGCSAAFNFVSLLPDGEVHACRKLPSLIGNLYTQSLDEIYHSDIAEKYRSGPSECRECEIRPLCGGCLAVNYGFGRDIFTEIDPYCFKSGQIGHQAC